MRCKANKNFLRKFIPIVNLLGSNKITIPDRRKMHSPKSDSFNTQSTMKKYIFQHCVTQQVKTVIAKSEYKALRQNFGNLAGYALIDVQQLNAQ